MILVWPQKKEDVPHFDTPSFWVIIPYYRRRYVYFFQQHAYDSTFSTNFCPMPPTNISYLCKGFEKKNNNIFNNNLKATKNK